MLRMTMCATIALVSLGNRVVRGLFALFLVCLASHGQIYDLATTDDGGQLYFVSSQRLKGTDLASTDKVFRWVDTGLELFAYGGPRTSSPYGGRLNASLVCCDLAYPSLTGDGRQVAYSTVSYCAGGGACPPNAFYSSVIKGGPEDISLDGRVVLSRNGRYILQFGRSNPVAFVVDTQTGLSSNLGTYQVADRGNQGIASDGTAIVKSNLTLALWKAGIVKVIGEIPLLSNARLSANGATVVFDYGLPKYPNKPQLSSYDIESGREVILERLPGTSDFYRFRPSVSADGSLVAYLNQSPNGTVQVYIRRTDGTGKRVLTAEEGNVSEVVLSGLGNVAFAVGPHGRVLKIDVATAKVTELFRVAPPFSTYYSAPIVAGGLIPVLLEGFPFNSITVNRRPAPLAGSDTSRLYFQVPWETETDVYAIIQPTAFDSPLEDATPYLVLNSRPTFFYPNLKHTPLEYDYVLAAHEDFGSLVTVANPALPGEIVHILLTGLGPVSPAVATGEVTPSKELHWAVKKVDCRLGSIPVDVLFAGLAPGSIGLNQIDLRVPDVLPKYDDIDCGGGSNAWLPLKR